MSNGTVLISGAGIAGPALAYWLSRRGFTPTVVERAPVLRPGGNAVDFRGPTHLRVLREMGVLDVIRQHQTHMGELTFVDEGGRPIVAFPPSFASGEVEIERGDLSRILYEAARDAAEFVFDDSIASLTETRGGVDVTFERGRRRSFDLVVGADGLHSRVRALAFGDESRFLRHHGYYVATFAAENHLGLDRQGLIFSEPGRSASVASARRPDEVTAMLMFASKPLGHDSRDVARNKAILAERFAGMGWEVPRLLEAMAQSPSLYFDAVGRIEIDHFSRGRVALLGDAGYGGTIGGQGTGLAVVCSYVLAGELAASPGDHRAAFERYEARIRRYALGCQQGAKHVGPFYAPPTRVHLALRNVMYRALTSRPLSRLFEKMVTSAAADLALPAY
jgi:2-polyprenyl-6-methoxyphenol hydroxylase-like FAD-dependent oxidoreductase